jgi:hypothetical protein
MSYIGAQPTTAAFVTDQFSANGSGTVFTLSVAPANTNSILVAVSGVLQDPSTYSVSGTTLTFSAAPPAGTGNISVRFLGIPASGVVNTAYRTQTEFTATAGQTTFSVPSYTVGFIDVYRNGALLGSADFTATNGTTVVLTNPASSGDLVETISFFVSSVLNAIPAQNNAVIDSYILSMAGSKLTGTQVIPKATLPTGSVLQVVQSVYKTYSSRTSSTYADTGLTASITPTSASNKILVLVTMNGCGKASSDTALALKLLRGSTDLTLIDDSIGGTGSSVNLFVGSSSINYLDSPATTSSTAYKVQFASVSNTAAAYFNNYSGTVNTVTSTMTLMEIAA